MTPDDAKQMYRDQIGMHGESVTIRRYTGQGVNRPFHETPAMARVTGYQPNELVGSIQQGDRKVILLAEDLNEAQFPLPVLKGDSVWVRGKELAIIAVDDSTRRVAGVLIAYELTARG